MEDNQKEILDLNLSEQEWSKKRRRDLLPWWIKLFTWIFLILGSIASVGLVFGVLDMSFNISIYGFRTTSPLSALGLALTGVYLLKGIVAYGLWTEKDWAIMLGQIEAGLGIVACVFVILYKIINYSSISFRLELLLLIPFLYKLINIKEEWDKLAERDALPLL
jgi:hypothetical protein